VESLFIAYRLTGNPQYREWGWSIFQAIEKHCKVPGGGYAAVLNVDEVPARMEDKMETFLMARSCFSSFICHQHLCYPEQSETLKYLYLLFDDASVLPLDSTCWFCFVLKFRLLMVSSKTTEYVFNTEVRYFRYPNSLCMLNPCRFL
jgi:hypothetical protein